MRYRANSFARAAAQRNDVQQILHPGFSSALPNVYTRQPTKASEPCEAVTIPY